MGLRQSNHARVHARILEVCETLFRARGFEATGVDDIAGAAEISRQTFFNYFAGKEAVLTELAIAWLKRQADLPAVGADLQAGVSVLDEARRWVSAQARAIEADRDFMALVVVRAGRTLAGGVDSRSRRGELGQEVLGAVAGIFRAGQSAGELRADVDPLRLAEVYVSAMLMTVRLWLLGEDRDGESLEARVNTAIDILEGGLRAPKAVGAA